tara:strand:+ start:129 stop:308 length:180 start_codon:yes stop_codon:yes gene_type:complete
MQAEIGDLLTHAWVRSGICMMVGVKWVDDAGERLLWVHWIDENETEGCWESELKHLTAN